MLKQCRESDFSEMGLPGLVIVTRPSLSISHSARRYQVPYNAKSACSPNWDISLYYPCSSTYKPLGAWGPPGEILYFSSAYTLPMAAPKSTGYVCVSLRPLAPSMCVFPSLSVRLFVIPTDTGNHLRGAMPGNFKMHRRLHHNLTAFIESAPNIPMCKRAWNA